MFLQGPRVNLRAPEREHIPSLVRWLNQPEVYENIMRIRPLGAIEEEEFLANAHKRPEDLMFVISLNGGAPIGCCGMHKIHAANRSAELGIIVGEREYWNRGFGGEAMNLLCRYGFQILNLNRLGLSVYEYNRRAIRCYEKVGFRQEGVVREGRFWEGRYWNIHQMGILAAEWRALREPAPQPMFCQAE